MPLQPVVFVGGPLDGTTTKLRETTGKHQARLVIGGLVRYHEYAPAAQHMPGQPAHDSDGRCRYIYLGEVAYPSL